MEGIFAWAVLGVEEWIKNGLSQPQSITDATATYKYEMDPVNQFIDERCNMSEGYLCRASDLYHSYRAWCESEGNSIMHNRAFGLILTEKGYTRTRRSDGNHYVGIKPKGHL